MPRFLKERSITWVTSLSRPGRILGRASRMVTSEPRSESIDANSHPITPPPMIAARLGSVGHREHLVGGHHDRAVDVEAGQRARQRARREHDRVAGELHVVARGATATVTRLPACRRPCPSSTVTLRPFSI